MKDNIANIDIKPNKRAFVTIRIASTILGFILTTVAVVVLSIQFSWWILLGLILVAGIAIYDVVDALVSFNKQRYKLDRGQVYFDEGRLFSDRKTELKFENITTVRVIKPFIEYNIFGTGKIKIEAAGSKSAAVTFRSIDKPYEVFENIKQILGKQTFSLTYDSVLSQKKPSPLAVMLQIAGSFLVLLFFVVTNVGVAIGVLSVLFGLPIAIPIVIGIIVLVSGVSSVVIIYRDQARRTYSVYNDVIHFSKGYLTRQEAFIPAANLANTELTQNLIGKLLNLQDVVVSCQGQGGKINFANLRNGEDMQKAINSLINNRGELFKDSSQTVSTDAEQAPQLPLTPSDETSRVKDRMMAAPTPKIDDVSAQDYRMDIRRALMSSWPAAIFLPALPFALLQMYIAAKRTVYRLTDGGVASYYSFLSTKNVELSRDKITGLILRRSPVDRWMNTCSVEFWSIGSGTVLRLRHIAYSDELVQTMKAKAGLPDDEELEVSRPQFTIKSLIKANLWSGTALSLLIIVSLVLALIISAWFYIATAVILLAIVVAVLILDRRYKRTQLRLGRYTTALQIGVLFRKKYWALNKNIKRVTLTKYPMSGLGTVRFDIAGEHPSSDNGANKNPGFVPNQFSVPYINNVADELNDRTAKFDAILAHNPQPSKYQQLVGSYGQSDKKASSRPDLKNKLLIEIPVHVLIFPLLVILPVSIFGSWYWIRRISYACTDDRVVKRWGVIYRKQTSIIFSKLDYTENGQGLMNKICKNGNVYLYTAGSSDVELTLHDMSDYLLFHRLVAKQQDVSR